jgi:sulfate permease, SulP family
MTSRVAAGLRGWYGEVRPEKGSIGKEALAGVPGAIGSVPDGMAAAVLAGVNPVFGLYASFAGPIAGGLTASTRLMVITTTSAAALAAGSALAGVDPADRPAALFLLTLVAGILMVAAGIMRLGRYTRFVSHSVMIGFLTGVAVNIVAGQIPDLTGVDAEGRFAVGRAVDVLLHPTTIDFASLLVGLAAIAILVIVGRTPWSTFGAIVALAIPTAVVAVLGATGVATVSDVGEIPSGLPVPQLPELRAFSFEVLAGALAVAAIVLVQGTGVAESAPNRDGSRSDANRDFMAQGAGNIASGLFRGMPVGGSVGQTALNVAAGARSHWAAIFSGAWMLVILIAFGWLVGRVAMPTLAAVLIVAAIGSLRVGAVETVWRTGGSSLIAMATTFLATLFLPVAAAVGLGVALSLLLQLNADAMDLRVVELRRLPDGGVEERRAPMTLPGRAVTVLDVYGSLLYAGARTLEARLPNAGSADVAVVVLRLRGRTQLGATALTVLRSYAERLSARGGRLYLTGLDPAVLDTFQRAGHLVEGGPLVMVPAGARLGASTEAAVDEAKAWIAARDRDENAGGNDPGAPPDER